MLKADDRIEKLLNRFGQTISDIPKPIIKTGSAKLAYDFYHRNRALQSVEKWFPVDVAGNKNLCISVCLDYICHQSDVIEKLVTALEVANNRIQGIRETAAYMAEKIADLQEDQRDAGFDEACMEIVELIDSYSTWKGEEKSADE